LRRKKKTRQKKSWVDSGSGSLRRFDADSLFELATLLEQLTKSEQKG
jgi:hypothetical protein